MELEKKYFVRTIQANRGTIKSLCRIYYAIYEDQKDAFQDIVLQLWKSFDSFRGESEINTWIYRVSLNTILTKLRKSKKSVTAEPIDIRHHDISTAKADDNVELLSIIIQSLKDVDKAIMVLHLEGYGNREISEILKLSPTNIGTRLSRVKSELKKKFNMKSHAIKQS